ncbi:MAG: tetratricopeptide repeat protein [Candidatus Hydrogenedentes bacterium]|nr:tetratricopeptide repeat protein [Candidatus Hydrogenedentota bacterium]
MPNAFWRYARGAVALLVALGAMGAASATTAAEFNALGVDAYNAKQWDQAAKQFEQAYKLAPDNATVKRNLCNTYQAQANECAKNSDFASGVERLLLAVSADPENPSALAQLGAYYLRLDMVNDAVFRLEDSVELDPDNLDVQELLGDAYYRANDLAAALAQWELVRERDPNRRSLIDKLNKAYREEGVEGAYRKTRSAHFEISYAPNTSGGDLGKVLQTLERAYRDIGRKFGNVYPPTPIQVVAYTAKDFSLSTQLDEHIGAVYDGKIRVPIRDEAGAPIPEAELWRRLFHEYTHVVVRYWGGDSVPWWLNEGLAETFSNRLSSAETNLLREASAANLLIPLSSLEEGQLKRLDADTLQIAYMQSHATVEYLWGRYGIRGIGPMLDSLTQGTPPEEALIGSYRLNYDRLQKEVSKQLGATVSKR